MAQSGRSWTCPRREKNVHTTPVGAGLSLTLEQASSVIHCKQRCARPLCGPGFGRKTPRVTRCLGPAGDNPSRSAFGGNSRKRGLRPRACRGPSGFGFARRRPWLAHPAHWRETSSVACATAKLAKEPSGIGSRRSITISARFLRPPRGHSTNWPRYRGDLDVVRHPAEVLMEERSPRALRYTTARKDNAAASIAKP